ncbi:MAG: T9SS type A sorting domain-containing protein [Crocinitomicaceae bacterium]|nr:T9SS type A sorting domain-containing protein [Crocinitomicaceae bacterium]
MCKLSLLIATYFIALSSLSQSIEVIDQNGDDITDDTIYVEISYEEFDVQVYTGVRNTNNSTININVTRTEVDALPYTSSYFCWGSCTGVTPAGDFPVVTPSGSVGFAANAELPASPSGFTFYYDPNAQIGSGLYKIQFFNIANTNDTANVFISITSKDFAGITENQNDEIKVYPNPCADYLQTNAVGNKQILNEHGQVIQNTSNPVIQTSTLPSGKYFLKSKDILIPFIKE